MNVLRLTYVPTKTEAKQKNAIISHGLFLTHLIPLSQKLQKLGVTTEFYSAGKKIIKNERFDNFPVHRTLLPQRPFFLPYGFAFKQLLKKSSNAQEIDLVHAHNPAYAYYFGLNRRALNKKPLFITWHGFFPYKEHKNPRVDSFLLKKLAKFAYFIPINEPSVKQLKELGVPKKRMRLITTGVDASVFKEIKLKKEYFLFVGRLVDWKNVSTIVQAFAILLAKNPKEKLLIIGSGKEKEMLAKITQELGIEKNISFIGSIDLKKMPKIYSKAKALVVPHLYDSFGKTVIEASACGVPVITTDDDIPKDFEPHLNLIPTKQAKNKKLLAKEMEKIIKKPSEQNKKAQRAKEIAITNYTWDCSVKEMKEFYLDALKTK
jgi:L-malate glycosyltransferase